MKFASAAMIAFVMFSACQKDLLTNEESVNADPVSSDLSGPSEFSNCKLRRIVHEHGGSSGTLVNGLFTYNAAGNPVSLTYAGGGTGNQNHYFFYDKQNRLREWREAYNLETMFDVTMHRYGYNESGVLTVDTLFTGAQHYLDSETVEFRGWRDTTIISLTYDSQGRVVKEAIRSSRGGATRYPTYTYDNRGNLGVLGWKSSSYDNKVSIFRSHPVFQFIFRNYSRNNAAPQARYNSRGLPLAVDAMNDSFFAVEYPAEPSDYFGGGIYKAIYDCQ